MCHRSPAGFHEAPVCREPGRAEPSPSRPYSSRYEAFWGTGGGLSDGFVTLPGSRPGRDAHTQQQCWQCHPRPQCLACFKGRRWPLVMRSLLLVIQTARWPLAVGRTLPRPRPNAVRLMERGRAFGRRFSAVGHAGPSPWITRPGNSGARAFFFFAPVGAVHTLE